MERITRVNTFNGIKMKHYLKTWPEYFVEIKKGRKTFEVRKNDRDFKSGDMLVLLEWDNVAGKFTGDEFECCITYMLPGGQFGIEPGFVVMALKEKDY